LGSPFTTNRDKNETSLIKLGALSSDREMRRWREEDEEMVSEAFITKPSITKPSNADAVT